MLKSIQNTFKLNDKYFLLNFLCSLAVGLIFVGIACIIMSEEKTYVPLGSIVFGCFFAFIAFLMGFSYFSTNFNLALKMGETRRNYLVSMILLGTAVNFIGIMLVNLFVPAEEWFYRTVLGVTERAADIPAVLYVSPLAALLIALAIIFLGMFSGYIVSKFGKTGFMVVYLTVCFMPMILNAVSKRFPGVLSGTVEFILNQPGKATGIALVPLAALIGVMYFFMSKKAVEA